MTIGTSNQTQISIIKEVTAGVTPANPELKVLRMTGETFQASNQTVVSEEIRADRQTANLILTDQSNSGEINGELSGATYDDLFAGALFADAAWTNLNVEVDTIAATATGFTDSANGFVTAGVQVGQFVKISGFTNPLNNRAYKVLTVVAGEITTEPAPAAAQASGNDIAVVGSTIKNGVTDHSFTIQKTFKDLDTESYINFRGCRVSTMNLTLSVGSIASISFGLMGLSSEVTETQITGATYVPQTTTEIMNCVNDVTRISANGDGITTELYFTDLTFSYDNGLRELKAIGTLGSIGIRPGTINANATLNPYFENIELLNAFLENQRFDISFNIRGSDGYEYIFSYPSVKFTSQSISAGSKDQDLIISGEVRAILDPVSVTTIRIDRFIPA